MTTDQEEGLWRSAKEVQEAMKHLGFDISDGLLTELLEDYKKSGFEEVLCELSNKAKAEGLSFCALVNHHFQLGLELDD